MQSFTFVAATLKRNFLTRLYKHYIIDSIVIVKKFGFKELFRRRGLKFLVVIFTYYLVRDTVVYVLIPLGIAKGIF